MKYILALLILAFSSTLPCRQAGLPLLVHAQTPSVNPLRDSVQQKVNEQLSQIKQNVAKKGFVGQITSKNGASLVIANVFNQTRSLTVAPDATVKLAGGTEGTPDSLKVGDFILAMGNVDSQNTMTVKRLLVISKPELPNRKAIFGTVTKVSSTSLTVNSWTVKLTSITEYTGKTTASDIKVGSQVVILGTPTSASSLNTLRLHLISSPVSPTPSPTVKP